MPTTIAALCSIIVGAQFAFCTEAMPETTATDLVSRPNVRLAESGVATSPLFVVRPSDPLWAGVPGHHARLLNQRIEELKCRTHEETTDVREACYTAANRFTEMEMRLQKDE